MTRVGKLIILVEHEQLEFSVFKYFLLQKDKDALEEFKFISPRKKYFLQFTFNVERISFKNMQSWFALVVGMDDDTWCLRRY